MTSIFDTYVLKPHAIGNPSCVIVDDARISPVEEWENRLYQRKRRYLDLAKLDPKGMIYVDFFSTKEKELAEQSSAP